jgi:hypothetical protein
VQLEHPANFSVQLEEAEIGRSVLLHPHNIASAGLDDFCWSGGVSVKALTVSGVQMPLGRSKARRQGRSRHGVKEQADCGVIVDETNSERASGEGMVGCVEDERLP